MSQASASCVRIAWLVAWSWLLGLKDGEVLFLFRSALSEAVAPPRRLVCKTPHNAVTVPLVVLKLLTPPLAHVVDAPVRLGQRRLQVCYQPKASYIVAC